PCEGGDWGGSLSATAAAVTRTALAGAGFTGAATFPAALHSLTTGEVAAAVAAPIAAADAAGTTAAHLDDRRGCRPPAGTVCRMGIAVRNAVRGETGGRQRGHQADWSGKNGFQSGGQ